MKDFKNENEYGNMKTEETYEGIILKTGDEGSGIIQKMIIRRIVLLQTLSSHVVMNLKPHLQRG